MIYLAFDFGDGTTCAARFDDSLSEPVVLNIKKGQNEVWTNIAFDKNGENPAVNLRESTRTYPKILSHWKSKPSKLDDKSWKRKASIVFMRECFNLFLSNNQNFTDGENHWTGLCDGRPCRVVIGVPCDWDDEDISEYKKMADEAGLPDVLVFKESQAAVLYARKFMAKGLPDEYLEKGVLMIDIGSSTTDFTYMKGLRAAHCGLTLGAKYVEQSFLGDATSRTGYKYYKEDGDAESKEHGRDLRTANLLKIRQWKENFFSDVQEVSTTPLPGSELRIGDEEGYITPDFVDRCLNDDANGVLLSLPHLSSMWLKYGMDGKDTWRGFFRHALRCVEKHWGINASDQTIFITGGASRMDFVENDIRTVFGEKVRYFFGDDGQRSFSVVKGLAWVAYATDLIAEKRKTCEREINNFTKSPTVDAKISNLISGVSDEVARQLVAELSEKMRNEPSSVNTKRKIEAFARFVAKNILESIPIKDRIISLAKELLQNDETMKSLFSSLQEELGRANICTKMPDFTIGNVELPKDFQVDPDLNSILGNVTLLILAAILGSIAGPVAAAIAVVVATWLSSRGPDDEFKTDEIIKAASKISNRKNKIATQIREAFSEPHNGVSNFEQIRTALAKILIDVKFQELKALEGLFDYEEQKGK